MSLIKLISFLQEHGLLLKIYGLNSVECVKPTHGNCCTCQDCGYSHDECICVHNETVEFIKQWLKEQPQGVEVWVSWDEGSFEHPTITIKEPKQNKDATGRIYHTNLGQNISLHESFGVILGLRQGECKKYIITEVQDGV